MNDKDDHIAACKREFGPNATVADWTYDLKQLHEENKLEGLIHDSLGIKPTFNERNYFVTNENEKHYGSGESRVYFFEDHAGEPPNNWAVHDQLGPISLGSWYGVTGQVLCKIQDPKKRQS